MKYPKGMRKERIKKSNFDVSSFLLGIFGGIDGDLTVQLKEQKKTDKVNRLKYNEKNLQRISQKNLKLKQGGD